MTTAIEPNPTTACGVYIRHACDTGGTCRFLDMIDGGGCIDGTGTARRLRALAAIGHSATDLAGHLDLSGRTVLRLRSQQQRVTVPIAEKVSWAYDELSMIVRVGPNADQTKARARAQRWSPPLAWDDDTIDDPTARSNRGHGPVEGYDEIALERAMSGEPVRLTKAETAEVVRRLTDDGHSAADIAARLDLSSRAIVRWRSHITDLEQAS